MHADFTFPSFTTVVALFAMTFKSEQEIRIIFEIVDIVVTLLLHIS